MTAPRAPANRAEVAALIAEAVAFNWRDSMQHKALNILAALESAGVRLVPVEATEEMEAAAGGYATVFRLHVAASPYAPEGGA